MSSQKTNVQKAVVQKAVVQKAVVQKAFCKICFDAGKPENVYTSHFVKDVKGPEGKVLCPYLLSLTCSYCKQKTGHTLRYCPLLEQKNNNKTATKTTATKTTATKTTATATATATATKTTTAFKQNQK